MAVVGRGCRLLTLYINPKHFRQGDRDWAFLASLLRWVRHNAATLQHTELILGEPFQREPYGYAHFAGHRGILSLRNARKVFFEEEMGHLVIAQDLMTQAVTVTPAESLRSALKKFLDFEYGQLVVVDYQDERRILGLLSHEDIIQAYNEEVSRRKLPQ